MNKNEFCTIEVSLRGLRDIMFDRYSGDNKTELSLEKKMYFGEDGETLVMPAANIMSLLTSQNTMSAPKRFLDVRKYKHTAAAFLSYITIEPFEIPFTHNGKPIKFDGKFIKRTDPGPGVYEHISVARLDKGIPNPKRRPVLKLPWSLQFKLHVYLKQQEFSLDMLEDLLKKGLFAIGLGTFRGVYGKAEIKNGTKSEDFTRRGLAGLGVAGRGWAWLGEARRGKARQG